ncbi:MAG: hypothetical protein H0T60_02575 [Acidobacteria bacterium]|nr:hypothetical protein [Acidobacteriota bacterium]
MAKIVLSDKAPEGVKLFSLANAELDLSKTVQTTDPVVVANANSHPWLEVEPEAAEEYGGGYVERQLDPKDDFLSSANSIAFNPEEIKKIEESKFHAESAPTAIEAGKDQDKKIVTGGVAETIAADQVQANKERNN